MDWWFVLAVFLFLVCALFVLADVFIPSGGLLGICGLACLIGGIWIFFNHSLMAGWIGIAIAVVMVPSVVIIAYKIFPRTRFGKSVTLEPPHRQPGDAIQDTEQLKEMLDQTGVVLTTLRPVGMCDINGKRIECVAEGGFVPKDRKVKVIKIEGTQVTVRTLDNE
jgi:membrane-bound serine protease (ClpP class)